MALRLVFLIPARLLQILMVQIVAGTYALRSQGAAPLPRATIQATTAAGHGVEERASLT